MRGTVTVRLAQCHAICKHERTTIRTAQPLTDAQLRDSLVGNGSFPTSGSFKVHGRMMYITRWV